jgi:hypothetical protein
MAGAMRKSKSEHRQMTDAGTKHSHTRGCGIKNVNWVVYLTDSCCEAKGCLEALLYMPDLCWIYRDVEEGRGALRMWT